MLRTLFASPEFKASLGQKFKDPMHYAVSAVRATYGQQVILNAQPMLNWLNRMGEPLYGHETPDGYPMTDAAWSGPGEMETRFEIARQIGLGPFRVCSNCPTIRRRQEPAPPPLIQQTRYYQALAPTLVAGHARMRSNQGQIARRPQYAVPVLARIHASLGGCPMQRRQFLKIRCRQRCRCWAWPARLYALPVSGPAPAGGVPARRL